VQRREFIRILGGAAAGAWSFAASAQQPRIPRVGYLSATSDPDFNVASFRDGMRANGYVEGRDFMLEVRYAERDYSKFEVLIAELLRSRVDIIVTGGPASKSAPIAAQSVPVVFGFSGDPIGAGIVTSFARPGGNVTGVSFLALELAAKRVSILKEVAPNLTRLAVLSNPDHVGESSELRATQDAAKSLDVKIEYFQARTDDEIERALPAIAASRCDGLLSFPEALTLFHIKDIAQFALQQKLPSIYGWRVFAQNGGLVTYGPNLRDAYAHLATFVVKILKGTRPADLPVELPTKIETLVNLKTAKLIGVPISTSLLLRADEVIE
jgi:putative ABC transport system substrate-binding protein